MLKEQRVASSQKIHQGRCFTFIKGQRDSCLFSELNLPVLYIPWVLVQHKLIIMSLDSLYHATNKRLSEAQDILSTIASNRIHVDNETLSQKHREISARVDHILR